MSDVNCMFCVFSVNGAVGRERLAIIWACFTKKIQCTIVNIFLIIFNICFGCSKEPSHRDGSFEYQQHMFWLRNKKVNFSLHTLN